MRCVNAMPSIPGSPRSTIATSGRSRSISVEAARCRRPLRLPRRTPAASACVMPVPRQCVILDDRDARRAAPLPTRAPRGMSIANLLPRGSRGSYVTHPPYFSAIRSARYTDPGPSRLRARKPAKRWKSAERRSGGPSPYPSSTDGDEATRPASRHGQLDVPVRRRRLDGIGRQVGDRAADSSPSTSAHASPPVTLSRTPRVSETGPELGGARAGRRRRSTSVRNGASPHRTS